MKKILLIALVTLLVLGLATIAFGAVGSTKIKNGGPHNMNPGTDLSVAGSGEPCAFCHIPHNAQAALRIPLSNRAAALGSVQAICMSCHDGATAVSAAASIYRQPMSGALTGGTITNTTFTLAALPHNLGGVNHPVGVAFPAPPNQWGVVTEANAILSINADASRRMNAVAGDLDPLTCSSCHDVHNYNASTRPFLRIANNNSQLCTACHDF